MRRLSLGMRLPKPAHCSEVIYEMLMQCWHDERRKRPKFSEILETLVIEKHTITEDNDHEITMENIAFDNKFVSKVKNTYQAITEKK